MIHILGDCCLADWYYDPGFGVGTALKNGKNPFCHLQRGKDDFYIGNFECVCCNEESSVPFTVLPSQLDNVTHLDLYGVANNHVMQGGDRAFNDTIGYFDNRGIPVVGADTRRSVRFSHQGKRVGVLAFSLRPDNFTTAPLYWHLPELKDIKTELESLKDCDFVIAMIHWGYEFINYPTLEQRQLAHWLVDNGVDVVAGMHPHVSQGKEVYGEGVIYYSLGNAVFNMNWEPTHHGLEITVDLSGEKPVVSDRNLVIGSDMFPRVEKEEKPEYRIEALSPLIFHRQEDEKYFREAFRRLAQYRKANRKAFMRNLVRMKNADRIDLVRDFVRRKLKR